MPEAVVVYVVTRSRCTSCQRTIKAGRHGNVDNRQHHTRVVMAATVQEPRAIRNSATVQHINNGESVVPVKWNILPDTAIY